ncbi:MAG: ABC transporter permease [Candidatus Ornithospirochaeta sp.]
MSQNTVKKRGFWGNVLYTVAPALSIVFLVLLWFFASKANSVLVPTPAAVFRRFLKTFTVKISGQYIWGHIWASLRRVLIALAFSCGLGIPFGILIGWNKKAEATLGTLFELIRPIPPIAWLPLVIMLMGIGELPKVVIVFIGTFTPMVLNTATSIKLVDPLYLNVGRMFNANNRKLLFGIALPASLPAIFAGFRTATSGGLMVVMAAEMIGAQAGLGFLIQRGMDAFDVPLIMVGMIVIGVVGALLAIITNYVEKWVCHGAY